jgi:diguanylate cyclase (GGDEF)-like protein
MRFEQAPPRFATAEREHAHTERMVLTLQVCVALSFVIGSYIGLWDVAGTKRDLAAAWLVGYHVALVAYSFRFRMRGRTVRGAEPLIAILNLSCATTAFVVLGDPTSPFWTVYLYALVGYARRYQGRAYVFIVAYTVANLASGYLAMGAAIDGRFAALMVMTVAMAALAHTVGAAWRQAEQRARLLAEVDPLTGIANRRTFFAALTDISAEPESGYAVLMLDLDNFKRLNDEFGHQHGDDVLVAVARLLTRNVRGQDTIARYGGEEFIVAMPGVGLEDAVAIAQRVRASIQDSTPTTISIGCAVRQPGESADEVVRRADNQLLSAKRTGKNAVRFAAPQRRKSA